MAAHKLDLCWSNMDQQCHYSIAYTESALNKFLTQHPELQPDQSIIGVESTGDYHLSVTRYFLVRGFTVRVLNPILTKQYIRTTIRGSKTDKKDAEIIGKLIKDGYGDIAQISAITDRHKELLRLAHTLTKSASQLTLRLQSTRRKAVGDTARIERKIEKIIASLKDISDELVHEATDMQSRTEELIDSIPGFAAKLSAIVYHELGDIGRFSSAKSLVAYAGLDPRIKQSGALLHTTGRLMKRGSSYLRYALYLAANVARRYDPELAQYYAKKTSEGRKHREVLCMISRKLLYRIWAVIRDQREYVVSPMLSTENGLTGI